MEGVEGVEGGGTSEAIKGSDFTGSKCRAGFCLDKRGLEHLVPALQLHLYHSGDWSEWMSFGCCSRYFRRQSLFNESASDGGFSHKQIGQRIPIQRPLFSRLHG